MISSDTVTTEDNTVKYKVVAVEKIQTPDGLEGKNWYEYVIGYGRSQIIGKKTGTLNTVTEHAQTVADDLNIRDKKGSYYAKTNQRKK